LKGCEASLITKKIRGSISNIYEILRKTEHSTYGKKKSNSIFNDYEQRNYNFTNLETMLLGRVGVTFEDCLVTK